MDRGAQRERTRKPSVALSAPLGPRRRIDDTRPTPLRHHCDTNTATPAQAADQVGDSPSVLQLPLRQQLQLRLRLLLRLRLQLRPLPLHSYRHIEKRASLYSNGADKLLVVLPVDAGLLPVAVADPRKIHDNSEPWDTDALL
jgi:hypothetical protein